MVKTVSIPSTQKKNTRNKKRRPSTSIDPVTANVIQGALENIAVEMGYKLMRMSYSSIIRESEDFGAAIIDQSCEQLCESRQSTPLQSGPIPGYVRGVMDIFKERGEAINAGDVIMHNSAYHGASHGPDVAFLVPVFLSSKLAGFAVTTAHHLDIGALSPGSCGIVDAMDAYAEGLQFKALKVYDKGKRNEPIWQLLRDNIRAPDLVVGDMEAQISACRIGADRYLDLIKQYGLETVELASEELMSYSERLMRNAIAQLPDGSYSAEGHVDGFINDPERRHYKIVVTLKVKGDEMTVDLTGTSPQCDDRPINMPLKGTVDCAIWLTLRSILLDSETFGHIPQNSGLIRPISIVAPEGSLANPSFPAPTIARFVSGNIVADTLMKSLSKAVPDKVSAGVGNLKVIAFSGLKEGTHWVHMDIHEGSYGGRYGKDAMDAVDTLYANTRNNPIEDIESHLPLRVSRYELRSDSSAAGKWRGGIGSIREVTFLEDSFISIEGDGHAFPPWGYAGGKNGKAARVVLHKTNGKKDELPSMMPNRSVKKGESITLTGTCGGGYGNPLSRNPEQVTEDVKDGLISKKTALSDYGVVLTRNGTLDKRATQTKRKSLRSKK